MKLTSILFLFVLNTFIHASEKTEIKCLALNIYHEARSSNLVDQVAVGDVVFNRINSSRYPNTICGVVHQAKLSKWHLKTTGKKVPIKNKCQFSWYCDGKLDEPTEEDAWQRAKILATQMYKYGAYKGITEGAVMYHAFYVDPYWAKSYHLIGTIGLHKYYTIKD
jgi:spore germination cell wall hydrolase CwlJ-like protein